MWKSNGFRWKALSQRQKQVLSWWTPQSAYSGYNGIIEDVCPKCGRTEDAHNQPFERIRRITGYLVGTLDRFNDAKRAEEHDRVKHDVPTAE